MRFLKKLIFGETNQGNIKDLGIFWVLFYHYITTFLILLVKENNLGVMLRMMENWDFSILKVYFFEN